MNWRNHRYSIALIASILISIVLYANTFHGDFVYDDFMIVPRQELRRVSIIPQLWQESYLPGQIQTVSYRPLTLTSFVLNFAIFGEKPESFHAVSILLNGIATFLVFLVIESLFADTKLAILSALLYSLFPIHTEAVANIKARDEILSTMLTLASLFIFLRGIAITPLKQYRYFILSSLIFFAALTAKEIVITAPATFITIYWLRYRPTLKKLLNASLFFIPAIGVYIAFRYVAFAESTLNMENSSILMNLLRNQPLLTRIWTAHKLLYLYISKIFIPMNLSATYAYNHIKLVDNPIKDITSIAGIILLIVLIGLVVLKRTRNSPLGIGSAIFLISYSPISKFFFAVLDLFAERWMYFPSVGLALIAAYGLRRLFTKSRAIALAIIIFLVAIYGTFTIRRNRVWQSEKNLYQSMIEDAPDSIQGYNALSFYYLDVEKDYEKARPLVVKGISIHPAHASLLQSLAIIKLHDKKYGEAEKAVRASISVSPTLEDNHRLLAMILSKSKKYQESIQVLETHFPPTDKQDPYIYFLLSGNWYKLGNITRAKEYFGKWNSEISVEEKMKLLEQF